MKRLISSIVVAAVVSLAWTSSPMANAEPTQYSQTVTGGTRATCDSAAAQLASSLQASGYRTTFLGCYSSNFAFVGTVSYYLPENPGYSQTVTGSTNDLCTAAATDLVRKLQSNGYITTFVGCYSSGFGYTGTVHWRR